MSAKLSTSRQKLSKILGMTSGELFFRTRRLLRIAREQRNPISSCTVSDTSYQMEPAPLLGFEKDRRRTRELFYQRFPDEAKSLIRAAKKIFDRRFDLLGFENLDFGRDVDWLLEPVSGKKIPPLHWSSVLDLKQEQTGDLKVVWELNRHQFLLPLGQAYFLTGEKDYTEEIVKHISDWRKKNPPATGPNWASSLEVAFRLISWIWAIRLIMTSEACSPDFMKSFAEWIGEHARHIEKYLSLYDSPNTHLTGEALGLFYAGVFFPKLPEAQKWRKLGEKILLKMLPVHLLEDGGYVERTIWYHQYTLNFYLHFFILLKQMRREIPPWAQRRLENGFTFFLYSLRPDRSIPLIGDDDGGYFMPLSSDRSRYPAALLAVSAAFFERRCYKTDSIFHPEILWLLGIDGDASFQCLAPLVPEQTSKGFQVTGYFFLRSGWGLNSNYMAFDCGPHGWLNGGHAHADLLSFHVAAGQQSVIEDPGTYCYNDENGWRNFFRGPRAHATLLIDGKNPSVPGRAFHWEKAPKHGANKFISGFKHDFASGSMFHGREIVQSRKIHFIKPDYFIVCDSIFGTGRRDVEVRIPLSRGEWTLSEDGCWLEESGKQFGILPLCPELKKFESHLEPSWTSPFYGKKEDSFILVLKGRHELPLRIAYLIDLSGTKPLGRTTFVPGNDVFKLYYKGESWTGFGTVEWAGVIREHDIETDCQAGLIRCAPSEEPEAIDLHAGSYLKLGGRMLRISKETMRIVKCAASAE